MPELLRPLASDTTGQLDVLGHDGDPLGVNGTQVCVFEEAYQIGLGCLLQGHHSRGLEPQVGFEILSYLPH